MISGYINDKCTKITVDCGAQKTIISKRFVNSLKNKPKLGKSVKLVGFTKEFTLRGNWSTVRINAGKFTTRMKCIVADIDANVLLGKDFFENYLCCLDAKNRVFKINEFSVPLEEGNTKNSPVPQIRTATLNDDVKLPPHQAILVSVAIHADLDNDKDLCIETLPNSLNIMTPACVVSSYPYARIYLENYNPSTVVLKAGTPVAIISEAEIITNSENTKNLNHVTVQ